MNSRHIRQLAVAAGVLISPLGLWTEAAPSRDGVFSGIQNGNHVCVELSTRSRVSGIVQAVTTDSITLDLQWEKEGMDGVLQLRANQVIRADVLLDWSAGELEERRAERTRRLQAAEGEGRRVAAKREAAVLVENKAVRVADASVAKRREQKRLADEDLGGMTPGEYREGIELLVKYPPVQGWGTASDKTSDWLKVKFAVIGALMTTEEKDFLDHYDLWSRVKRLLEAKSGKVVIPQGPGNTTPDNAWLTEKQPPDLPMESPPAFMLPPAVAK